MPEKYYTAEQAADLLKMHIKTVQRYIREGKLRANKVGKSWRITGHDLSVFAEGTQERTESPANMEIPTEDRIKISAVADIEAVSREEAIRIMNTLTAAMNVKPPEYGASTFTAQYLEPDRKIRIMLWGNLPFMEAMMSFISALTGQKDQEDRYI
jgi:excisionase family DNA binding protein